MKVKTENNVILNESAACTVDPRKHEYDKLRIEMKKEEMDSKRGI